MTKLKSNRFRQKPLEFGMRCKWSDLIHVQECGMLTGVIAWCGDTFCRSVVGLDRLNGWREIRLQTGWERLD